MSFDMSKAVAALIRMLDGKKEPVTRKPAQPLEQDLHDTWQELSAPPIPKRKPQPPVLRQEQTPPIPARKPVAPATRDFADTLPGRMFLGGGATGQWTPGDAVTKRPDTGTFLPVQPHGQYPGDFVESPPANRQAPVFTSPRPQGMGGGLFGNTPMDNTINNVWNTIIGTPADHAAQDDIKKMFPNGMKLSADPQNTVMPEQVTVKGGLFPGVQ